MRGGRGLNRKNAVIIGATSGIGAELATLLAGQGYQVAITGRREELLEQVKQQMPEQIRSYRMDVTEIQESLDTLGQIFSEMEKVDLVVISAGTGFVDPAQEWEKQLLTINTNVCGFAAIADAAFRFFCRQGWGHLAGISSLAAVRGGPAAVYNASKAFESSYLEGLQCRVAKQELYHIHITDIRPGLVDTAMAQGEGLFWVQPVKKAAAQIYQAILKKKKRAYVTKRWAIIAALLRILPDRIYNKM